MNTKQTILFGLLALLGGIIGGILSDRLPGKAVAKSDVQKVVRAEKFELVDARGRLKAFLKTDGIETIFIIGETSLKSTLVIRNGPLSTELSFGTDKSASVYMSTDEKKAQIVMSGKTKFPYEFHGILPKIEMVVDSDGNPSVQFRDDKDQTRLIIGQSKLKNTKSGSTEIRSTGSIVIFDEKGKVVYSVP